MAVLVTGGAGYIGSHICVTLLEQGYDIVVVDNFYNSSPAALERIQKITGKTFPFYKVDMMDYDALYQAMAENPIDAVIHLAGYKAVGESVEKPLMYYQNNLVTTMNLLEVMEKLEIKNFIFSSSATVYGLPEEVPVDETAPTSAISPYGATKLFIERILMDWNVAHPDATVVLLRYFNPVGAHSSGLLGENPKGIPNNLMPYIARVADGTYEYVRVYGDDYPTPDGTGVRDYIHVVDLAEGHVAALEWADKNNGTDIFNLGTGIGYSVLDIIHAYENACGKELPYKIEARRAGDAATVYGATEKAKKDLHWTAKKNLNDMCVDSWNFIQKNPNGIE